MHIDTYQFGKIVIDKVTYTKDCLIINGVVRSNWWRKEGHSLAVEDLRDIIEARPEILVIGCGASGIMEVPENTRQFLNERNIEVETCNTATAVKRFNELMEKGVNAAAALHLTC